MFCRPFLFRKRFLDMSTKRPFSSISQENGKKRPLVIVIAGPTGVGKSAVRFFPNKTNILFYNFYSEKECYNNTNTTGMSLSFYFLCGISCIIIFCNVRYV